MRGLLAGKINFPGAKRLQCAYTAHIIACLVGTDIPCQNFSGLNGLASGDLEHFIFFGSSFSACHFFLLVPLTKCNFGYINIESLIKQYLFIFIGDAAIKPLLSKRVKEALGLVQVSVHEKYPL